MLFFNPIKFLSKFFLCAAVLIFVFSTTAFAGVYAPKNVSALVYSSTAAELFWSPAVEGSADKVQVSRNGQVIGSFDARSLFQAKLEKGKTYHYELKTINEIGQLSLPVIVSINTNNFSLPVKRIWPIGQNEQWVAPPPPVAESAQASVAPVKTQERPQADQQVANHTINVLQTNDNCIAKDIDSLMSCVRNADGYRRIDLSEDISCGSNCCPSGSALMRFKNVQNLEIVGHGHKILRSNDQRQCSLLDINNSSNISFNGLQLDDDKNVNGCQVTENCPRMVHIRSSSNITFFDTHVSNGKGYAFYVQGTNGFKFEHGSLHNSGVLGMYVGHGSDASTNVHITHSTFSDNQTNGLALLGVTGSSITSNVVADNLFVRNHRKGQWPVRAQYGTGFTGGGQFYIAEASNVTIRNNTIKDGFCDNCFNQSVYRSGIGGIELGLPGRQSVSNLDLVGNTITNADGLGIYQNSNSSLSNNVLVRNNVMLNTSKGENLKDAKKSGNRVLDTQQFNSFENGNDLGNRFTSNVSCSSGGSVTRQCQGETVHGQCAVQLHLGPADCSDMRAQLEGPKASIQAGQVAVLSGWVSSPRGRWCAVFRDVSGNKLGEQCKNLQEADWSNVQPYVGMPMIEADAPNGSATVQLYVEHRQAGASMRLDDLSLSVGWK